MAWIAIASFSGHPGENVPEKFWAEGDPITDAEAKAMDLANKPDLATNDPAKIKAMKADTKEATVEAGNA